MPVQYRDFNNLYEAYDYKLYLQREYNISCDIVKGDIIDNITGRIIKGYRAVTYEQDDQHSYGLDPRVTNRREQIFERETYRTIRRNAELDKLKENADDLRRGIEDWGNVYEDWGWAKIKQQNAEKVQQARNTYNNMKHSLEKYGYDMLDIPNSNTQTAKPKKTKVKVPVDPIVKKRGNGRKIFILDDEVI